MGLAQSLAPFLAAAPKKPIYVDCNAVNPQPSKKSHPSSKPPAPILSMAASSAGRPKPGYVGPKFYLSGAQANAVAVLDHYGLECPVLDGGVGAASALKMSYAGITKGLTALGSIMILAASRAGMGQALHSELHASQPELLSWFERQIPSMFPKAYRWVAEMEEIAGFAGTDEAGASLMQSTARFYARLAADVADAKTETGSLARFFQSEG